MRIRLDLTKEEAEYIKFIINLMHSVCLVSDKYQIDYFALQKKIDSQIEEQEN